MFFNIFTVVKNIFHKQQESIPLSKGWMTEWDAYISLFYTMNTGMFENICNNPDILKIRPDFNTLNKDQKLKVVAYFWRAVALFESGYNPKCQSVDVGTKNNKDTWSVGLLQMSVVDQTNHKINLNFNFNDLLNPMNNLNLAMRVMDKQIVNRHNILIHKGMPGIYWATICPGGRYDKSATIIKMVQSFKV
jgi:hypothetical protein